METIVNTIKGTYIVPASKLDQLLQWLESNYTGRQLINE